MVVTATVRGVARVCHPAEHKIGEVMAMLLAHGEDPYRGVCRCERELPCSHAETLKRALARLGACGAPSHGTPHRPPEDSRTIRLSLPMTSANHADREWR
ncbi:hypothetical protein GCM10010124_02540 [Pilimelia terevasa]|uniref:Uncharacterized protein n=1 Tax=Pilimelia terevasa TaxID=53372 RepID=A0A8J3FDZ4_9ACTN|nr:hypothetical protein GCM10010124_02540 [Pilimelia terevasa]